MADLVDGNGNTVLRLESERIIDAQGRLLAVVEGRTALSPTGSLLGAVSPQGRLIEGESLEVVVVIDELRDAMGAFIGRFERATPTAEPSRDRQSLPP